MNTSAQAFKNGEVHDWYRIALGYSDHLVADLFVELGIHRGASVLDPFCGSGTTAVESMKQGVTCWSIDANPMACFATRVKTTWDLDPAEIARALEEIIESHPRTRKSIADLRSDKTYQYLKQAGMLARGWISAGALYDIIALKRVIRTLSVDAKCRDFLLLALANELVRSASNVKFGPELYCVKPKRTHVVRAFTDKVNAMSLDLKLATNVDRDLVTVLQGDSRLCSAEWLRPPDGGFSGVVCSPPYPTEHDYTRNSRLELALMEAVVDRESLRTIKKAMIRSHTKGMYVDTSDAIHVAGLDVVQKLANKINKLAAKKTYGFARLYAQVVREYFGGMHRHFASVIPLLKPGAKCAYVVGDQASYFQVPVSTASILAEVASGAGFMVNGTRRWRQRWSSTSRKYLDENILFLQKPSEPAARPNGKSQKDLRSRESARALK